MLGDFVDGVTQLPREIVGGAAVALGADAQGTKDFLGLTNEPSALDNVREEMGIVDQIEKNPAQFIGELVPYLFLPTRLFGKAAGKALRAKAEKTGKGSDKLKSHTEEVGQMGLAFGTYGAIEEAADATLDERDAEIAQRAITDGLFTVGIASLAKVAFAGAQKYKSKAKQSKYIKDMMLDAGVPPSHASQLSKLSIADQRAALIELDGQLGNVKQSLAATLQNTLPSVKFKEIGTKGSWLNKLFAPVPKDVAAHMEGRVEKIAQKKHTDRPPVNPEVKPGNVAEEASAPIGLIRMSADDMNAHLNIMGRHANAARTEILKLVPKLADRQRITAALDIGGKKVFDALTPEEKIIAEKLRETLDQMGKGLQREGIIKGFTKDYIPHLLNKSGAGESGTLQEMLDSVAKRSHSSTSTARGKTREFTDKPLHERPDALTTDIADLLQLYTIQVGQAAAMKNVMRSMSSSVVSKVPVKGWKALNYGQLSKEMLIRERKYNKDAKYQDTFYVHPDFKPSLDLLLQSKDMNQVMKGVVFANFASKRALILGSLFHFNALSESALFANAGGFGAVAKGAGAGFVISGFNPLGAAVGAGLGSGAHVLLSTKNVAAQLRGGKYGDIYDYTLRYVDMKPPRDVGTDEFYNGLHGIQGVVDKYVPTNTARGALKKGTRAIGGINKGIDVLMWHRLMSGAKMTVFQRQLENLIEKNMALPAVQQRSQHELATLAGQFVNDAFGGQNWRKLAEGVDNAFGRRFAAAMASPKGMTWANLAMFAPDWTTSNLRVLAKAFPGINKDSLSRQMYQRYAVRGAIYYAIIGTAIQQMLTGKPIWENDDPTKLDLGDGRTMTFSKQLMEPFHWVDDPVKEAMVKQSSLLKLTEELATNQQWIGGGNATPRIWEEDDSPLVRTAKGLEVTGRHFAPIFVQDVGRNGPEGIYGFFGHPIYGSIRHGFKNSDGKIEE